MYKQVNRREIRSNKQLRIRNKIEGTPERPRLNVFRSNQHIYAQIVDDEAGATMVSASSLDPQLRTQLECGSTAEAAKRVGQELAARATAKGIKRVVFDRAGYLYHGRVKALAEGAREGGLEF